jgi:hypothetical protein
MIGYVALSVSQVLEKASRPTYLTDPLPFIGMVDLARVATAGTALWRVGRRGSQPTAYRGRGRGKSRRNGCVCGRGEPDVSASMCGEQGVRQASG